MRVAGNLANMLPGLRREVAAVEPSIPVAEEMPMMDQVEGTYRSVFRTAAILVSSGLLVLFLSALGLYVVLAFAVSQRTREIGIRVALGAQSQDVLSVVLAQALRLAALGTSLGVACALVLTHALAHLLYGVSATDRAMFSGTVLLS